MPYNGLRLGVVLVFGEEFVGKTNAYLETRTPFYLNARITPTRCYALYFINIILSSQPYF